MRSRCSAASARTSALFAARRACSSCFLASIRSFSSSTLVIMSREGAACVPSCSLRALASFRRLLRGRQGTVWRSRTVVAACNFQQLGSESLRRAGTNAAMNALVQNRTIERAPDAQEEEPLLRALVHIVEAGQALLLDRIELARIELAASTSRVVRAALRG